MRVSNVHTRSISRHCLLFLSITVISGRLCSRLLAVCIGKSHKILQASDSKNFSGFYMYHFSALLNAHFSHSFQWSIMATLSCFTCLYSFCVSFEHFETICATVLSATPHARQMDWTFSPYTTFLIFLVHRAWSFASYFPYSCSKLSMKRFSFKLFSMLFMYFFFSSSILIVFNDSTVT